MHRAVNFVTGKMWLEGKRHVTAKRKSSIQAAKEGHSCYSLKEKYFVLGIKKKKYHIIVTSLYKNAETPNTSLLGGFLSFFLSVPEI